MLIEQAFGWIKTIALMRRTRHRGIARVGWAFEFSLAVFNLLHFVNLVVASKSPCGFRGYTSARSTYSESVSPQRYAAIHAEAPRLPIGSAIFDPFG